MHSLQTNNQAILKLVDAWTPRLMGLTNDVINRISHHHWTLRQILGHLIDSASNNTHRIIHLQYQYTPFPFPDYARNGNNDRWVAIQDYKTENWADMVQLWKYLNLHLAHVISRIDPGKLRNKWISGAGRHVALEDMVSDYLSHLRLHLDDIEAVMHPPKIIVAIDGHAGSGKSTMAAELARAVGYAYIDTGAMYRAVTLYGVEHGLVEEGRRPNADKLSESIADMHLYFFPDVLTGRSELWMNGRCVEPEIRTIYIGRLVSHVAAITQVRKKLVAMQQEMGRDKGVVMDGRDIGTVVFPDAELKVFATAAPEARAKRRYDELRLKGENPSFAEVLRNVRQRDHIDGTRKDSPLRQAFDALLLDNSYMSTEEQNAWLLNQFYKTIRS